MTYRINTFERASDIVNNKHYTPNKKMNSFCYWVDRLQINRAEQLILFAKLCDYPICSGLELLNRQDDTYQNS